MTKQKCFLRRQARCTFMITVLECLFRKGVFVLNSIISPTHLHSATLDYVKLFNIDFDYDII